MFHRFTNPAYDALEDDQLIEQSKRMEPLRQRHQSELIASGAAERIISSTALGNRNVPRNNPINEGTYLYPHRRRTWNLSGIFSQTLSIDAGILSGSAHHHPTRPDTFSDVTSDPDQDNFLLLLGRTDIESTRASSSWSYQVGIHLTEYSAKRLRTPRLLPFARILQRDVELVQHQLQEISDFALTHDLAIVDQVTLSCSSGELEIG